MPTDPTAEGTAGSHSIDAGLLTPVSVGYDAVVSDAAIGGALIAAEVALVRAWAASGTAPTAAAASVSEALGWRGAGRPCALSDVPLAQLTADAVAGGNPVIPLVAVLRDRVPESARTWVHRGATSQDIMDSALMLTAKRAATEVLAHLDEVRAALSDFAEAHRADVVAARTLTQQAVPTTVGLRASNWMRGIDRAADRLRAAADLPAQLAGAGGTLASFVEIGGADVAVGLPTRFAEELGLREPDGPWHTERWPVTEFGDALVQVIDALGKLAADVTTLSRTEIGELSEGTGGGSSAMPQKQNPARSVLIRSAAIRAPHLGATLHTASALAVDERPDGAWHAEWPALRDLLRAALGASAQGRTVAAGLRADGEAGARNLGLTRGLILAERLNLVLTPIIGAARVKDIVARAGRGEALRVILAGDPDLAAAGIDVDELLDPAHYTGLASRLVESARRDAGADA